MAVYVDDKADSAVIDVVKVFDFEGNAAVHVDVEVDNYVVDI